MWGLYGRGHCDDDQANAFSGAIEARRAWLSGSARKGADKPLRARSGPCKSPDRARSIGRRRQLAASGAVPGTIASSFTTGELAVLTVIAREIQRSGSCTWFMDRIAAVAGVSRTTARNALRRARTLGLLRIEERRRHRWRNDTNVISILSPEWIAWLRLGGGGKKAPTPNNQYNFMGDSLHLRSPYVLGIKGPEMLNGRNGTPQPRPENFSNNRR